MTRTIFFFLVLLIPFFLAAGPIEDQIKNAEAADYPDADMITVFDSTRVEVQESGLSYVTMHRLYKVFNFKGAKNLSVIKIDYDPQSAYVEIRKAVIHKKDGTRRELGPEQVIDYPAPARAIYWGAREKMLEIGRLDPGDAVEVFLFRKGFTYALLQQEGEEERYIPPMRGHFYDIVEFWSSQPVRIKCYQVVIPKEKTLQYEFYHGQVQSSAWLRDNKMHYTFTMKEMLPVKSEPGMVALSDVAPKLLLSTSPDWNAKSLWFYGVNEDYGSFLPTPEIQAKVDQILEGAKTETDSISLLTHWVADEIRYSGISMGEGEGYTLHTGHMTFTDRCGVCKDKAGMLITMLRAAGFESYPAMTMAGSRIELIPADQFNHCVTLVKRAHGEYELLDPTWVPFIRELWSSAEQQQNYLMGVPESADLAITPISPPENHSIRIRGTADLDKDGTYTGSLVLTAEGQSDAAVRSMFTRSRRTYWKELVETELLKVAPQAVVLSCDFGDPYHYLSGPITLKISYKIPDYALITDQEIIFQPVIASGFFKRIMPHLYANTALEVRKFPFRDRCSRWVELDETITVPSGYASCPSVFSKNTTGDASSFDGMVQKDGNTLRITEKMVFGKRIYEPQDWPAYRDAVKAQNEFAERVVVLKKD
ncbi:MAG TPA: DUF3857 and transglutaminase domain-containing protein [Bacteroidales bacterium]|nr:DUF3857 and transglutaminase domain-containing protein [Bacteroidales bacterium]